MKFNVEIEVNVEKVENPTVLKDVYTDIIAPAVPSGFLEPWSVFQEVCSGGGGPVRRVYVSDAAVGSRVGAVVVDIYAEELMAHVNYVCVASGWRRKGIGEEMLTCVVNKLAGEGIETVLTSAVFASEFSSTRDYSLFLEAIAYFTDVKHRFTLKTRPGSESPASMIPCSLVLLYSSLLKCDVSSYLPVDKVKAYEHCLFSGLNDDFYRECLNSILADLTDMNDKCYID